MILLMADDYADQYYNEYWRYDDDIPEPEFPTKNVKRKVAPTSNPNRRRRFRYPS